MPFKSKAPIRVWAKVAVCLVAIDVLLFHVGIFWNMTPNFGVGLGAENWLFVFKAAAAFESRRRRPGPVFVVGSSVVVMGVDETQVDARLRQHGIPAEIVRLATHGSTCTDSALMAWNGRAAHPWLVIYAAAARDFPKQGQTESVVVRTFYDASATLPLLPRAEAESVLDAQVRRYWKLYRYRFFARTALETATTDLIKKFGVTPPSLAADAPPPTILPREAFRYFSPFRITPKSYAAWAKWHASRRFDDYLAWLQIIGPSGVMALANYKLQTLASFGPDGNPQADSLRWMLGFLQHSHIRTVLLYFPENPVFRDPAAKAYFDEALSRAYADLFAREAAAHGARFVDLRDFVEPEGFYDLVHLNLVGERKVSERVAEIIEEEWRAREQQVGGAGGR